jgi:hypothetical protein
MAERRCRRSKQLLDDLKYKKILCKMNEEALDRTLRKIDFGRGHGPSWGRRSEKITPVGSCYSVSNWSIKKSQLTWSRYRLQYNKQFGTMFVTCVRQVPASFLCGCTNYTDIFSSSRQIPGPKLKLEHDPSFHIIFNHYLLIVLPFCAIGL